jgi:tripartite-type tricarboxylate transporter receptor subunit TctC
MDYARLERYLAQAQRCEQLAKVARTRDQLAAERFMLSAGIKAVHVPFRGAPDVLREILGGRSIFISRHSPPRCP